jgi:hypothetical protein
MSLGAPQSDLYWKMDRLGRVRLSAHFYMRQFLYSEIAVMSGIMNLPDDPDLAVKTGTHLCAQILEPIVRRYGPIVLRSGFRSEAVNDFGAIHRLQCASSAQNYAYHIWDRLDGNGHCGAAACIIVPAVNDANDRSTATINLISFMKAELDFNEVAFFKRETSFNIGWHEKPVRTIRR